MFGLPLMRNIEFEFEYDEEKHFVILYFNKESKKYIKYSDVISNIIEAEQRYKEDTLAFPEYEFKMIPYEEYLQYIYNGFSEVIYNYTISSVRESRISLTWIKLVN